MKQNSFRRKERTPILSAVISVCMAEAVLFGGALVLAAMVSADRVGENGITGLSRLVLAIAGFAVGLCSAIVGQGNYPLTLAISAAVVYLGLIGMNVFAFGGELRHLGACTAVYLLGVGVSALLHFLRLRRGHRRLYGRNFR